MSEETNLGKPGPTIRRGRSNQDVGTDPLFMDAVVRRFGEIDFDLAASKENAKSSLFYTKQDDSLTKNWNQIRGSLWLNPPFDNIGPWAKKCLDSSCYESNILLLVPASVGSNWFRDYVWNRSYVMFLNGRLTFEGQTQPYPKDCLLAYYGSGIAGSEIWNWKQNL